MIIVVEGMDRCGKDTLIKHIRKHVITSPKTTMIHCTSTPSGVDVMLWPIEHYKNLMEVSRALSDDDWTIILNRSHLGEDVYGKIYRNVESSFVYQLEKGVWSDILDNVFLITLVDSKENLMRRDDGESPYTSSNDIDIIKNRFIKVHNQSNIKNKLLIDYSTMDREDQLNKAKELVQAFICRGNNEKS